MTTMYGLDRGEYSGYSVSDYLFHTKEEAEDAAEVLNAGNDPWDYAYGVITFTVVTTGLEGFSQHYKRHDGSVLAIREVRIKQDNDARRRAEEEGIS